MIKSLFISFFLLLSNICVPQCLQANIMLVMDWSGSEQGNEIILANSALLFIQELPISEYEVKIGVISFSNEVTLICPISSDKDIIEFKLKLLASSHAYGGTFITPAIDMALDELYFHQGLMRNIIIIVSDGEIADNEYARQHLKFAEKNLKFSVFAVQIGNDYENLDNYLNLIRLTGNKDNIVMSSSRDIVDALKRLNLCN